MSNYTLSRLAAYDIDHFARYLAVENSSQVADQFLRKIYFLFDLL